MKFRDAMHPTLQAYAPVEHNRSVGISDLNHSIPTIAPQDCEEIEQVSISGRTQRPPQPSKTMWSFTESQGGRASMTTVSSRLSSRSSIAGYHVRSILALSTRSSQISSARSSACAWLRSNYSSGLPTGSEPQRVSIEGTNPGSDTDKILVHEAELDLAPSSFSHLSRLHKGSVYVRPCCSYFEYVDLQLHPGSCTVCGNNRIFCEARICEWIFPDEMADLGAHDNFGNTVFHFAASAGNLSNEDAWKDAIARCTLQVLSHRNTSGETFLHVLHTDELKHFVTCLQILRAVANRGFDLSIQDNSGCTISRNFTN